MDLLASLRRWSRLLPERPAMLSGGQILTYRDLDRNSDALAAYLSVSLPDDHSPLAVIGHKEPEILVAFLAAAKSGHPYIPIDTSLPQSRIDTIIERSSGHPLPDTRPDQRTPGRNAPPAAPAPASPDPPGRPLVHHLHLRQHRRTQRGCHHLRLPGEFR